MRGDREDGRQRVGEDVDKGGAKIVIVMLTGMTMIMVVVMIATAMVIAAAQKQRTDNVDDKPDRRHDRRFRKSDLTRLQQTPDRLDGNPERDDAEDQCGCEAGKISDLARTEAEAAACGIALGEGVGTGCDRERSGMRRHMEAVRQQRHRVEDRAGDDFADHHHRGQDDHPQRPTRILIMGITQEDVVVPQDFEFVRMWPTGYASFRVAADHRDQLLRTRGPS